MNKVFKVGLIGCGHIAETYFRGHQYFNNFKIVACADINQKAAEKCAKLYNIKSMTVNEILKDKDIEVILNLTIPQSHYSVSKKVLNAGKHVYSEKPLAIKEVGKVLDLINKLKSTGVGVIVISHRMDDIFTVCDRVMALFSRNKLC